jgi:hypothetical protein
MRTRSLVWQLLSAGALAACCPALLTSAGYAQVFVVSES